MRRPLAFSRDRRFGLDTMGFLSGEVCYGVGYFIFCGFVYDFFSWVLQVGLSMCILVACSRFFSKKGCHRMVLG